MAVTGIARGYGSAYGAKLSVAATIAGVAMLAAALHLVTPFNHDEAWFLHGSGWLLDGAQLGIDLGDIIRRSSGGFACRSSGWRDIPVYVSITLLRQGDDGRLVSWRRPAPHQDRRCNDAGAACASASRRRPGAVPSRLRFR